MKLVKESLNESEDGNTEQIAKGLAIDFQKEYAKVKDMSTDEIVQELQRAVGKEKIRSVINYYNARKSKEEKIALIMTILGVKNNGESFWNIINNESKEIAGKTIEIIDAYNLKNILRYIKFFSKNII